MKKKISCLGPRKSKGAKKNKKEKEEGTLLPKREKKMAKIYFWFLHFRPIPFWSLNGFCY